jgi:ATP-dependent DNA ligase
VIPHLKFAERRFERLWAAVARKDSREPFLYAFDLLELDGRDMGREPWSDRRWRLARLPGGAGHGVQQSDHMEGNDGESAFRHACAMWLEGIIAKRRDRPYRSGRCADWILVKNPNAPGGHNVGDSITITFSVGNPVNAIPEPST